MQSKETTITKTVTTEVPALQITLSIEEAKALKALGCTSQLSRADFLYGQNTPEKKYTDECNHCALLLGELFHTANGFLENQDLN